MAKWHPDADVIVKGSYINRADSLEARLATAREALREAVERASHGQVPCSCNFGRGGPGQHAKFLFGDHHERRCLLYKVLAALESTEEKEA